MYLHGSPETSWREPGPTRPPRTVRLAVGVMLAGAALEGVAAVVGVTTESSLRAAYTAGTHPKPSAGELHALLSAHGQTILAESVVAAAMWIVMAYANWRALGSAARITSAVLFAMDCRSVLHSFNAGNSTATVILGIIVWFVGLAVIVLLFSTESNRFYRHQPAPALPSNGPGALAG